MTITCGKVEGCIPSFVNSIHHRTELLHQYAHHFRMTLPRGQVNLGLWHRSSF